MSDVPASCATLVAKFEGFSARPYLDARRTNKRWTIGFGATTDLHGRPVTSVTAPVTRALALLMLQRTLQETYDHVMGAVTVPVNEEQEDALTSFAYNIGLTGFDGSLTLKKLNAGDYEGAANFMLSWNKAGGAVIDGLVSRRQQERALFLTNLPASADVDPAP